MSERSFSPAKRLAAVGWAREDLYDFSRWMFLQRKGFKWQRARHHQIDGAALTMIRVASGPWRSITRDDADLVRREMHGDAIDEVDEAWIDRMLVVRVCVAEHVRRAIEVGRGEASVIAVRGERGAVGNVERLEDEERTA